MAFLTGFDVSLSQASLLGQAAIAAFEGRALPAGWSVVTPATLGLAAQYRDGNYFTDPSSDANAIVLKNGSQYIVAFRGTDSSTDTEHFFELAPQTPITPGNEYIKNFAPLLNALKTFTQGDPNAEFSFTGASLGGGATNQMAAISTSQYGGYYADATFVGFASPNISNANGIVNFGVDNDPIYKSVFGGPNFQQYADYASSADNIILAIDNYLQGSPHQFDPDSHDDEEVLTLFGRLEQSVFYENMTLDSVLIMSASSMEVTDRGSGRENTGAFYLGRESGDRMTGRNGADFLEGFGGNDTLKGGGGNDKLDGGAGRDTLSGGAGDDLFIYKANGGEDTITDFTAGVASGKAGIDEITFVSLGVSNFAQAMGFASQQGSDTVFDFGSGNKLILLNVAMAELVAGDFAFGVVAGPNEAPTGIALSNDAVTENILGATIGALSVTDPNGTTSFNFAVSDSRFEVALLSGVYQLKLKSGVYLDFDTEPTVTLNVTATDGGGLSYTEPFVIDVLDGPGFTITGTTKADLIDAANSPPGQVRPSAEDDVILGMKGNDTIYGLDGNDRIDGGAGTDTLYGGEGDDTFEVLGKDGLGDVIYGGNGSDTLKALGTSSLVLAGFNTVTSSIENWQGNGAGLLGDKDNDVFDFSGLVSMTGVPFIDGGKGNDTITGSDFADNLRGNAGNDTLNGGDGNDTLTGGLGADTINGGEGDDTIVVAGNKDGIGDVYNGGNGSDTFAGTGVTLAGFDAAASSIEHWVGANTALLGDAGNNTFDFSYLQSVTGLTFIDGGKGNDTIIGSRFNDDLRGNAGMDRLEGGEGNDVLSGGKDADTFVFRADFGHDRITDFTLTGTAQDFIAFDQAVFADFNAVMLAAAQNGANVVITYDANNSLTLNNIQLAALTAGDFQFI